MTAPLAITNEAQRQVVLRFITNLNIKKRSWIVTIKRKTKQRSLSQNALIHMWFDIVAKETGGSQDEVKSGFCEMFCPEREYEFGGQTFRRRSTSALDTAEMKDFTDQVYAYAAQELGILLPHPDDLGRDDFRETASAALAARDAFYQQHIEAAGKRPDPSVSVSATADVQAIAQNLGRDSRERPAPIQGGEYKPVPLEPTAEMLGSMGLEDGALCSIWKSMYYAAPPVQITDAMVERDARARWDDFNVPGSFDQQPEPVKKRHRQSARAGLLAGLTGEKT